jgi:hypothetical protein
MRRKGLKKATGGIEGALDSKFKLTDLVQFLVIFFPFFFISVFLFFLFLLSGLDESTFVTTVSGNYFC